MPSDRSEHDQPVDTDDNAVLSAAASIDTTGIGILSGATAQVSVVLPGADDEFGDDDDLIEEAIVADEVEILHEDDVTDETPELERIPEPVAALEAADDADDEVEPAPQVAAAAGEPVAESDAAQPEPDVAEAVDAEPAEDVEVLEPELEPEVASSPHDDEPTAAEIVDADVETDAEDADVANVREAEQSGTAVAAIPADTAPEEGSDKEDAVADRSTTDAAHEDEPVADSAPATASVPVSRREANHTGPIARGHDVERVQTPHAGVVLASKRLGEFDADRESADLLTADRLLDQGKLTRPEPEGTWQHFLYSISGGRINLGDGRRARARKELDRQISAQLPGGAKFVPVLSRKGGVGKTTVTALLGMALADARDDRIIAVDANPDRGTLADRIARPSGRTVRDLVRAHDDVAGYNDISRIITRDQTRLDVLASDTDPRVSEAFSDLDYQDVAEIAAHYYSIVLTDTGTGIVHSVMGATLRLADELVIVSGLSVDEARLASETLTWLETNGYSEQVRNAVVVLNNSRPGAPLVRQEELEAHFGTRVRAVVRVPYDPHIATGSAITFRDLESETRAAARELAVAVVEGLRSLAVAA